MIDINSILEIILVVIIYQIVIWFPHYIYYCYFSRKCSYDCDLCKVWDCPAKVCSKHRSKL